jgi:hypothetical protein
VLGVHVSGPLPIILLRAALRGVCEDHHPPPKQNKLINLVQTVKIFSLFARRLLCLVVPGLGRAHDEPLLVLDSEVAVPAPQAQLPHMLNSSRLGGQDRAGRQKLLGGGGG